MSSAYTRHYSTRQTPQSEPIPGSNQVPNHASGYAFAVDKWTRLDRFLVLGAEGGTYYATEKEHVFENCEAVRECLAEDTARTIATIVNVSDAGRAPKNDPAVFALAMAAGLGHTAAAMKALPKVCRIGTHLFQFAAAVQGFRGWGRGLRKGLAAWYEGKTADALAYQVAKYQNRNGWSHRDLLRLVHPKASDPAHDAIYRWAVGGMDAVRGRSVRLGKPADATVRTDADVSTHLPPLIQAMEEARSATVARLIQLIIDHNLPRECIPTERLNDPTIWEALLLKMPLTAMVRNLGKMSAVGLLVPMSAAAVTVANRLADGVYLRESRLHPLAILIAAKTYAAGRGLKGSLSWTPVSQVNDALDAAFYHCLVPETQVLTADLRWIPLDDVQVGQELVSVDEFPPGGKGPSRKMRRAVVEGRWDSVAPTIEITMDDGRVLIATANHRFLTRVRGQLRTRWRTVGSMRVGDPIRWIAHPWNNGGYEDGWFAGFADGEGSFRYDQSGCRLVVFQKPGSVADRAEAYLRDNGYHYSVKHVEPSAGGISIAVMCRLSISRMNELFRLMGQSRPSRFSDQPWWEDKRMPGKGDGVGWAKIVSLKPAGERRVVDIQTSTGTFIAEGFVSHNSFGNVEPANKRTLMGLDVSGSMCSLLSGFPISCAEGAAAMAMVQAKTEPAYQLMAFNNGMQPLDISRYSRLTDVVRNTSNINCGGTDCSLPMVLALQHGWQVDTFQVYTDSETWAGKIHPCQALRQYREKTGIPAKLIVVGMASNGFTIADPNDAGMLDVCGFDTATPAVMSDFSRR